MPSAVLKEPVLKCKKSYAMVLPRYHLAWYSHSRR